MRTVLFLCLLICIVKTILAHSSSPERFSDLNVVCLGCSQGIGRATAKYLSKNGANVVACSRTLSKFDWVSEEYPNIYVTTCDAANIESISNLLTFSLSKLDSITGLVYVPTSLSDYPAPFHLANLSVALDAFDIQSSVDYKGYISAVRIFFDELSKTGYGSVISIGSIAAQLTLYSLTHRMHYGAVKAAQDYVMKSFAKSYAHIPIRFNSVTPGYIESNIFDSTSEEIKNAILRNAAFRDPMLRVGSVEEVGRTISFLLSREAEYITGITLNIDGGVTLSNAFDGEMASLLSAHIKGIPDAWNKLVPNQQFDMDLKKYKINDEESTKHDL